MRYAKAIFALIAFPLVLTSCSEDVLDPENPNQQTAETFWETQQDAIEGTNAAYLPLNFDGMYNRTLHIAQDVRGDLAVAESPFPPWTSADNFSSPTDGTFNTLMWDQMYQGVFWSNQAIQNVPSIEMDQQLRERLVAEAKFLRAHYYFKLVKIFRNVPLITEVIDNPNNIEQPQADPAEVWDQIIQDLKDAQTVLPESFDDELGRATWGAATAYLGKAYLFNEQWEQADAEFEKIINSGLYELVDNPRWNGDLAHENNAESIWEIQFSTQVGGEVPAWGGTPQPNWSPRQTRSITFAPIGFGWADIEPSQFLLDEFQEEQTVNGEPDPRLDATLFHNTPGETVYGADFQEQYGPNTDQIFWRKYESDIPPGESTDGSGLNIRAMRFADVLLMRAETQNEMGNQAAAARLIQRVRDRANMPDREDEFAQFSQQEMREQLAHERIVELAGEGKRFDDIRRWGWLDDSEKLQELQQHDPGFEGFQPGREVAPIPLNEIETNPAAEQNPGWN